MLEPRRRPGDVRKFHGAAKVTVVIVAAVVTLVVFEFVVGLFVRVIELAVVAALVAAAIHRISRSGRPPRS